MGPRKRKVKDMLCPRKFLMEKSIVEIMMILTLPMKMMSSRSFWEFPGKPQRRNQKHPKKKEQRPRVRRRMRKKEGAEEKKEGGEESAEPAEAEPAAEPK